MWLSQKKDKVSDFYYKGEEEVTELEELLLTGRYAPNEIIETADLVTEMRGVKHPYNKGFQARKGIEY